MKHFLNSRVKTITDALVKRGTMQHDLAIRKECLAFCWYASPRGFRRKAPPCTSVAVTLKSGSYHWYSRLSLD